MHYNTLFQDRNLKKFSDPTPPLGAAIVAPSALNTSRFRSVLYVPYSQCRLLATVTVTNVVQGKRSQRRKFTGPPNQKSWLRQCIGSGQTISTNQPGRRRLCWSQFAGACLGAVVTTSIIVYSRQLIVHSKL